MIRNRMLQAMERDHLDMMIVCSHENVAYLSGVGMPLPFGAVFDYGGGYPLGYTLIDAIRGKSVLIISDQYKSLAEEEAFTDEKVYFIHYDHFKAVDSCQGLVDALKTAIGEIKPGTRVGIEAKAAPFLLTESLRGSGAILVDGTASLAWAKQIKDPDEMERIRESVRLEDVAQRKLIEIANDFHEESALDMWHRIVASIDHEINERIDIWGELTTGKAVGSPVTPGGPNNRIVKKGDLGRMDISVRYKGYWCDCTNVVVFGNKPTAHQEECFKIVKEAYDAAFEKLRPGVRMKDADQAAAEVYRRYNLDPVVYTGHQIGCGVNEYPRIVCYEDAVFEEGMVVCIEPQQYLYPEEGVGIRLERVIEITCDRPKELNQFPWGFTL